MCEIIYSTDSRLLKEVIVYISFRALYERLGLKGFVIWLVGNKLPEPLTEPVATCGFVLVCVTWICWFMAE